MPRENNNADLCGTCAQYRSESAEREARVLAGEAPDEAPRPRPWGRYAIALLAALISARRLPLLAARSDTAIAAA